MMHCSQCGCLLPSGARFCTQCGQAVSSGKQVKPLRCRVCGGHLEMDTQRGMLVCPFCHTSELMEESDAVTIQRMKMDAYKTVEMEKLRHEDTIAQRQMDLEREIETKKYAYTGKYGKLAILCAFMTVLFTISTVSSLSHAWTWPSSLFAIAQCLLFGAAWLLGRKNSLGRTRTLHKLLALAAFAMFAFL